MEPKEFLNFAFNLPGNSEAANRSRISRGYYAAHHMGRNWLSSLEINLDNVKTGQIHYYIYTCLEESKDDSVGEAGRLLKDLYADRVTADYKLLEKGIEDIVDESLANSKAIFEILESRIQNDRIIQMKQKIKKWLEIKHGR